MAFASHVGLANLLGVFEWLFKPNNSLTPKSFKGHTSIIYYFMILHTWLPLHPGKSLKQVNELANTYAAASLVTRMPHLKLTCPRMKQPTQNIPMAMVNARASCLFLSEHSGSRSAVGLPEQKDLQLMLATNTHKTHMSAKTLNVQQQKDETVFSFTISIMLLSIFLSKIWNPKSTTDSREWPTTSPQKCLLYFTIVFA